ncbi:MAG: GAF domain-containing protein [Anaerolineae bacterium]|nr:GAF domain-containing protein [Anaerolineae bacterium]
MVSDLQSHSQKQPELELVLKLDQIRDTLHDDGDPQVMFEAAASFLQSWFGCEACAIMLITETSDDIELLAVQGIPVQLATKLCRRAMASSGKQLLTESPWEYAIGVQIILHDYPMGSFILLRDNAPFSEAELIMLDLVETQLDSAVVQARTTWKLTQRNRELEAIYDIDRLRDRTNYETELINGFTAIALQYFDAEICLVLLTESESNNMILRGVINKYDLSPSTLEKLQGHAQKLTIPQVIPTPDGLKEAVLLAAPFVVEGNRLGAVIVGREAPYSIADHRLLHAMMSQMDSAVVHSRIQRQLSQRKRELEVIYRIDQVRDREKDLDAMLQAVLSELSSAVSSEMGYIMLYSEGQEQELELRAFTIDGQIATPEYQQTVQQISRAALKKGSIIHENGLSGNIQSYIAAPLILNERLIGVIGLVNSAGKDGFNREDLNMLQAITSQVDTAIFERLEQRRMRAILTRSVDPKVVEMLLQKANANILSGERVNLTVLFADLRDSTEWAENISAEEFVSSLNLFLGKMTDVILDHGGTLDKFVGDMVVGLFGTPVQMHDHAHRAAAAALEMQAVHRELQAKLAATGHELPSMGIGISSGDAIAGEIGHRIRSEFTALGRMVNLGARLCGVAEPGQIVISETTSDMLQNVAQVNDIGDVSFKGIAHPTRVYELISVIK